MEFQGYYNNGLHIYRIWKVCSTDTTDGYRIVYELWQ